MNLKNTKYVPAKIIGPYEAEKSARLADIDQYTFLVTNDATKISVRQAFMALYGITPKSISIIKIKPKFRGQNGRRKRLPGKKAIVTLKKGTKIDLSKYSAA